MVTSNYKKMKGDKGTEKNEDQITNKIKLFD